MTESDHPNEPGPMDDTLLQLAKMHFDFFLEQQQRSRGFLRQLLGIPDCPECGGSGYWQNPIVPARPRRCSHGCAAPGEF